MLGSPLMHGNTDATDAEDKVGLPVELSNYETDLEKASEKYFAFLTQNLFRDFFTDLYT